MSLRSCPSCGESYIATATVCADCGVPLTAAGEATAVRLEPGDDDVGYDLDDWDADQRGELVAHLLAERTPHRWEEGGLIVRERDADWVEQLIDDIDHPDALEPEDDDDDGAAALLSALYVAADVLAGDDGHPGAIVELCEAEAAAQEAAAPYGVAPALWDDIRAKATALAELLDAGAEEEPVRAAARALRDAVRPLV